MAKKLNKNEMAKTLNKNEMARLEVYNKIADIFGEDAVGMYDKKLRINVSGKDGSIIQFAIAATLSKTPVTKDDVEEIQEVPQEQKEERIDFDDDSTSTENTPKKRVEELTTEEAENLKAIMDGLNNL